MAEPFLAEIRIVGFNFAPRGWAFCNGEILPITQNQSLYSLLGTTYGGDGRTSFALPDLRGRVPVHFGTSDGGANYLQGQKSGAETHTLTSPEMPEHTHRVRASDAAANADSPTGRVLAQAGSAMYGEPGSPVAMGGGTIANAGGGQAHDNMMPYLALNFCIALQGLFPSRN